MKFQHLIPILFLAAFCTVSAQTNNTLGNTNTPASLSSAVLHADDMSIKISLGIRDDAKELIITNYPLAFRIENVGKTVIDKHLIPDLFRKGIIHVLPKDGKEMQKVISIFWFSTVVDVKPGETFEHPVVGNFLTFFPSLDDAEYQVWWTLDDFKSNVLSFTLKNGMLSVPN